MRDHARDAESFHDASRQRLVPAATVAAATAGSAEVVHDELCVAWPDGPTTVFHSDFLRALGPPATVIDTGPDAAPWDGSEFGGRLHCAHFDGWIDSADALAATVEQLWRTGVVVVRSVPTDHESTRRVLERFGYVRTTIFGELWEFSSDGGFADTASTPLEITPHTDGTYSRDAPGLLGLHCHVYEATGGENVFVDGVTIAARLSSDARELLSRVEIPAQYIGDGAHLMAKRPALREDGGRLAQVSYNHHDRMPFMLPEREMRDLYAALHEFDALANLADLQGDLALRPGDMVIVDNWRVLHGRRAFRGERLIAGGYVNREDLESTTRLLRGC